MSKFKREERYIVLKISDVESAFNVVLKDRLESMQYIVNNYRRDMDKVPLQCVVVEHDWPEYEKVWKMIEKRMADKVVKRTNPSED